MKEKRNEFFRSDSLLAQQKDNNLGLTTQKSKIFVSQLQSERDLLFSVYSSLSQQYQEAKLDYNKSSPLFKLIEQAVVPTEKSKPRRFYLIIIFSFIGFALGMTCILIPSLMTVRDEE